jgi:hypothetical protein
VRNILVFNAGAAVRPGQSGAHLPAARDAEAFFASRGVNTGDLLVYDAILRHLAPARIGTVRFATAGDPATWPREQPDLTIIRGSNYIAEELDFGHAVALLRHLRGPVVAIGVGAQAPVFGPLRLSEGSTAFWRLVGEKSTSLGVRGAWTAEVLAAIGVRNTRVIGCPSLYRAGRPLAGVAPVPAAARTGLTLNRMLAGAYTQDAAHTRAVQQGLLRAAAAWPVARLYAQGEREEMLLARGHAERRTDRLAAVLAAWGMAGEAPVAQLFERHLAAHMDVEAWAEDLAREVDVVLGLRLHGNILALQQGQPALMLVADARMREMAQAFRMPAVEVSDLDPARVSLSALVEGLDFAGFAAAQRAGLLAYRAFLEENGIAHRLPALTPGDENA